MDVNPLVNQGESSCGGMEVGITQEELQQSIVSQLTEPSRPGGGISSSSKGKAEGPVVLLSAGWLSRLAGFLALFKVYLRHLGMVLVTAVTVLLACSLRGDVLLFGILTYKSYHQDANKIDPASGNTSTTELQNGTESSTHHYHQRQTILPNYLQLPESYNMPDLLFYMGMSILASQLMYHVVCGFLQLYFYTLQRDQPEKWKCQPHRFLTRSNEMHEVIVGTANLVLAGGVSGFLSCWILNGHYSKVYFRVEDYGYPYLVFSVLWLFVWLEASAYYSHALFHTPWLYKNIHKHHHRYHAPTAYSAIAMSPFELVFYDSLFVLPLFLFPIHGLVYVAELVYVYYFGLMDHSGIKMESWFPWQPDSMFHDDHHRYFHCNFGFNASWFDRLHGTMRQKNRVYGETVFGGRGTKPKEL